MDCLDDDTILGFVEGVLALETLARVESHARACERCQELLSASAAAASASSATVRTGASIQDTPRGPVAHGTLVGRYTVLALVGRGGMGEVYAAHDPKLDRTIALKLLRTRPDPDGARDESRLMREAQAIARLSHPNVITVHDVGAYGDRVFLAMEYVEGQTLSAWLADRPRTRAEILAAFRGAAHGLMAAHAAGLVHRDFKPQNVMMGRDGKIRVTDFGMARRIGAIGVAEDLAEDLPPSELRAARSSLGRDAMMTLTQTGELLGTPRYMAPEQIRGAPTDARTDQFSFCVALYEALCGEHPFVDLRDTGGGRVEEVLRAILAGPIRPVLAARGVPSWLRQVVLRGLSVTPAERWPSMGDLVAALARDRARSGRRVALVGMAAAAAAVAAALVLVRPPRAPQVSSAPAAAVPAGAAAPVVRPSDHEARTVTVAISSEPAGARVVSDDDGAAIGTTPFRESWPRGSGVQKLRIERQGYRPELVVLPLDRDLELALRLERAAPAAARKSRPPEPTTAAPSPVPNLPQPGPTRKREPIPL